MRITLPEPRHLAWAGLALAVLLAYANSLFGDFQFDDYNVIVYNTGVQSWAAWWQGLGHGIRPLLKFSYTLSWTSGLGAAGFHLLNIAVHLINVLLVFALTRQFLRLQPRLPQQVFGIPFFTALIFAVHPVHTEAVTYISGRSIALMTLFYLAGLLAYAAGRERKSTLLVYGVTPLCFIAAISVKETAVTFPLALLAWHLASGGTLKEAFRFQWPSWAVLALGSMFFLLHGGYLALMANSAGLNSLAGNMATQADAFYYLMRQWFLPLWLNIDPDLHMAASLDEKLPQLVFLAAVFIAMLAIFRRRPWLGFALAWALLQLVPLYWFLPRTDVANERQLYLVSWPLALALVTEGALFMKQKNLVVTGVVLAAALACLTVLRNQDYRSEVALWESTVALSPGKARVHNNLGMAYELAGRTPEARLEYAIALRLNPDYRKARDNLERLSE
jgi:tetratricopeptide (TPR) repeat protein